MQTIGASPRIANWFLRCASAALVLFGFGCNCGFTQDQKVAPQIVDLHVGFSGAYKLGCWAPVEVVLSGGTEYVTAGVAIIAPDTDGVPTVVASPSSRPVALEPGRKTSARMCVRVGQSNSPLQVKILSEDGKTLAARTFQVGPESGRGLIRGGLPATNRLLLEFGSPLGLGDLLIGQDENDLVRSQLVRVESAAALPTEWYGYESIDTLFMTTSQAEMLRPLLQNPARMAAIQRWVEMGGKIVVFCGASAEEFLGDEGPLASLVPAEFDRMIDVRDFKALQSFSQIDQPLTTNLRAVFSVPLLTDVQGYLEVSSRRGSEEIPLVIRSVRGFGNVTFVGLDFDRPPFRDWAGRTSFLKRVAAWNPSDISQQGASAVANVEADDLINEIRSVLDHSFADVHLVPFALVAFLVVCYILLIGPGDYFLVNRVFKRPEWTWVTFPVIVVAVSAGAYWYANRQKGDALRVNQVEFVDIDASTHFTRGTTWTHFFTPRVAEFDLAFEPRDFRDEPLQKSESLVAWLGQPGYALGGMQAGNARTTLFESGYKYSDSRDAMLEVPVQLWSTKTITARWLTELASPVEASLSRTDDQLVVGRIMNHSDQPWLDCVLLYGQWAWDVGQIPPNSSIDLAEVKQPRTVRTLLTSATAGDTTITQTAADGTVQYRLAKNDITRLAKMMMFYQAINGDRYSGKLDRYQSFLDMSHFLEQPDKAILVSKNQVSGGRWLTTAGSLGSPLDRSWTYYRIVLPVAPPVDENIPTDL